MENGLSHSVPPQFEVVQLQFTPNLPRLKRIRIPKLVYAIFLRVLYNFCYDRHWDTLSHRILVHKFNLFPELRRWQIERWVARFRRQNLFPNTSESELRDRARQLVMGHLI
jgi:hypothetical protein